MAGAEAGENRRESLRSGTLRPSRHDSKAGSSLWCHPDGVFPGGVATAPRIFDTAQDLPWKSFTAGLVRAGGAAVLPVHCAGQNGLLFHAACKLSQTIRTGLLISAFRRLAGRDIRLTVGPILPAAELGAFGDRRVLTDHLRRTVLSLGCGAHHANRTSAIARERHAGEPYPPRGDRSSLQSRESR